jgi:hypothetical protein
MGGPLNEEEAHVIQGVLDLSSKTGSKAMTTLDKVFERFNLWSEQGGWGPQVACPAHAVTVRVTQCPGRPVYQRMRCAGSGRLVAGHQSGGLCFVGRGGDGTVARQHLLLRSADLSSLSHHCALLCQVFMVSTDDVLDRPTLKRILDR